MGRAERGQFAGSSQAENRGTIEAEQKEVQRMNYPAGNPYQPYYPYPAPTAPVLRASAAPRYEIIHVTGRRGAEALQMAPNSSVLALDDTAPLVWLCRTDGAGYLTVTPFDIAQHAEPPAVNVDDLSARLTRLEEMLSAHQPDAEPAKPAGKRRTDSSSAEQS